MARMMENHPAFPNTPNFHGYSSFQKYQLGHIPKQLSNCIYLEIFVPF
uniref:Uncharacterized protein n=1 Tax=Rhizophora mucronata TaxID=61149 RepID=A0A2P2QMI3_RHIMU